MVKVSTHARNSIAYALSVLLLISLVYSGYAGLRLRSHMINGNKLVHDTVPYSRPGVGKKFLIIGDSLAYGVGTTKPQLSFAGQIGARYPDAEIINKAKVGDDIDGMANSITELADSRYDSIFILIGGNDVARYGIDLNNSLSRLSQIYEHTSKNAEKVYVYSTIRFTEVSAIPEVLHWYYAKRADRLYYGSKDLASTHENMIFVDTYMTDSNEYDSYEASDGFHLNDAGIAKIVESSFVD